MKPSVVVAVVIGILALACSGAAPAEPIPNIDATVDARVEPAKASLVGPTAAPAPEVVQEAPVEVIKEVIVEKPVEVILEVLKEVQAAGDTVVEKEVMNEVVVEKTVEVVLTATPTPMPVATPTATPTPLSPANDPYRYAAKAMEYYRAGLFGEAIQEFNNAIKLHPHFGEKYSTAHGEPYSFEQRSEWFFYRGMSWLNTKQYHGAVADFTEAVRWDPTNAEAQYNRGVANQALGKSRQAEIDFAKATPTSEPTLLPTIEPTSEHMGPDPYRHADAAYSLYEDGRYSEAILEFNKALKLYPFSASKHAGSHGLSTSYIQLADWYFYRALSYHHTKQHWGSIADYAKAYQYNPNLVQAYYNRGISFRMVGVLSHAKADLDKACELDSRFCQ